MFNPYTYFSVADVFKGLIGSAVVYNVIITHKLNMSLESVKSELAKSQIRFTTYHNMQVESLKLFHNSLVEWIEVHNKLIMPGKSIEIFEDYKKLLNEWIKSADKTDDLFEKEKIYLPDKLVLLYNELSLETRFLSEKVKSELNIINEKSKENDWCKVQQDKIYTLWTGFRDLDKTLPFLIDLNNLNTIIGEHFRSMNQ